MAIYLEMFHKHADRSGQKTLDFIPLSVVYLPRSTPWLRAECQNILYLSRLKIFWNWQFQLLPRCWNQTCTEHWIEMNYKWKKTSEGPHQSNLPFKWKLAVHKSHYALSISEQGKAIALLSINNLWTPGKALERIKKWNIPGLWLVQTSWPAWVQPTSTRASRRSRPGAWRTRRTTLGSRRTPAPSTCSSMTRLSRRLSWGKTTSGSIALLTSPHRQFVGTL